MLDAGEDVEGLTYAGEFVHLFVPNGSLLLCSRKIGYCEKRKSKPLGDYL